MLEVWYSTEGELCARCYFEWGPNTERTIYVYLYETESSKPKLSFLNPRIEHTKVSQAVFAFNHVCETRDYVSPSPTQLHRRIRSSR